MFLTRARARVRGFDPDPDALQQIARLCTRLDGLPLAIELAAIRMDAMTPAELIERLPWRLTVLRGGAATDPRHRTLRALVDWSFDRLSAPDCGIGHALGDWRAHGGEYPHAARSSVRGPMTPGPPVATSGGGGRDLRY